MSLRLALLLSIALHATLVLAPAWQSIKPRASQPRIEVRLTVPDEVAMEDANVSTEPNPPPSAEPSPRQLQRLAGAPLRSAQAALSRHLFYPPEAVARGLEGEVILLLSLTETGQVATVDIARSSGHPLLDQAAVDAARRIGKLQGARRQMLFPVNFRLQ